MNYASRFHSSDDEVSSDDSEIDETLVRELRESLHFSIGRICRAEEQAARQERNNDKNDNESNDEMMTTSVTDIVMSKEAIAALTELIYHYSTSSLASDLCAFSNHAKRQTVKAEDVLLVARKDKQILADLQRKVDAEQPEVAAGNRSSAAVGNRQKKKNNNNNNNRGRKTNALFNSGKKKSKGSIMMDSSSSSSSSSDSEDEQDVIEKMRQRRLDLKQKNLSKTAFGRSKKNDSSSSSSSSDSDDLSISKLTPTNSNIGRKQKSKNANSSLGDSQDEMVIDLADSD